MWGGSRDLQFSLHRQEGFVVAGARGGGLAALGALELAGVAVEVELLPCSDDQLQLYM